MVKNKYLNLGYLLLIPVIFGIVIVMSSSVVKAEEEEVVLNVKGMTCGMCSDAIKKELLKVDGVKDADVSHKEAKAVVNVEAEKANVDELIHAVEKAGFSAEKG